jgi:two-component system KDP operon response regulator KdpE
MTAPLLLVIEDELPMRRLLRVTLKHHGFRLAESPSGIEGAKLVRDLQPDLVLVDLGLPDLGGFEVMQLIRRESEVPIVVLSARDSEEQKVLVLDAGADDYVTKPFSPAEMMARIRAALRRTPKTQRPPAVGAYRIGELEIDFDAREVRLFGRARHVTPKECDLLQVLVASLGKVVRHEQLLREVWGPNAVEQVQYLRVFMKQLRQKLEPNPGAPRYLVTEPGIGYRLRVPS